MFSMVGGLKKNGGFTSTNMGVVEMPKENSLDIDSQEDFDRIARIYKMYSKN